MAKKLETLVRLAQIKVDHCLRYRAEIEKTLQQLNNQSSQIQRFRQEYHSALSVEHSSGPIQAEAMKRYTRLVAMLDQALADQRTKITQTREQLLVAQERYYAANKKLKSYQKIQDKDEIMREQQRQTNERRQMDAQGMLGYKPSGFIANKDSDQD